MKPAYRWPLLLTALAIAAWLALFGDKTPHGALVETARGPAVLSVESGGRQTSAPRQAVQPLAATQPAPAPELPIDRGWLIPTRPAGGVSARNLFVASSWNPPPPPAAPATPPTPTAPPMPFSFLGKKLENGHWEVYVVQGEQTYIARPGEVVAETYRIDSIAPPTMKLTYLPLNEQQALSIGEAP